MNYADKLLEWFHNNKREMPWRNSNDPYAIWVSEIMLQQTQVDTVIPYYEKFMQRFPTIHSLASAKLEEVFNYWQGLGYYRRAENLYKGAQMVDREYDGIFPKDIELIKKIPGVGPYTAGAIASIAFHTPAPAVDGNVMRVLARQFLIEEDISQVKNRKLFEQKVMELIGEDPNSFNQALMELGALVCTPKNPSCKGCPMQNSCMAYESSSVLDYPVNLKKVKIEMFCFKVLLIRKKDEVWMEKRPKEGLLANLWGFPILNDRDWETFKKLRLSFELSEEVTHVFTHRKWRMTPVLIEWDKEAELLLTPFMNRAEEAKFVKIKKINELPVATAFKRVMGALK